MIKRYFFYIKKIFRFVPISSAIVLITFLMSGLMPAVLSFFTEKIINLVTFKSNLNLLYRSLFFLFLWYLFDGILKSVNQVALNAGLFEKTNLILRKKLAEKCMEIPLLQFEKTEFLERLTNAKDSIASEDFCMLYYNFVSNLKSSFTLLSVTVLLYTYHPLLSIFALLSTIPIFINRMIRGKDFANLKSLQKGNIHRSKVYRSWLFQDPYQKELRLSNSQKIIQGFWEEEEKERIKALKSFHRKDYLEYAICEFIKSLGLLISIAFTFLLVFNQKIEVSMAAAALLAFQSMQSGATSLFQGLGQGRYYLSRSDVLFEIFKYEKETITMEENDENELRSCKVVFTYPQNKEFCLGPLDFVLEKNKSYAIVGSNGAGKSTIAKLLMGLYPPKTGVIQRKKEAFTPISYMPQKIHRFKMTVQEFFQMGNDERISENQMLNMIKTFDLPLTPKTVLGREFKGVELSGGEWQKLYLAKMALENKPFLIFDEPTSNIDPLQESKIYRWVLDKIKGKTSLIITHRLALCPYVDEIIHMEEGKIIAKAHHQELLKIDPLYHEMVKEQGKWYGEDTKSLPKKENEDGKDDIHSLE
ncbi:MAG: ABC transporter ATP-binding protein [Tissierellia bacterium]|nr:ABC transporter ATP-binding protein [Tissierellia bacterium]